MKLKFYDHLILLGWSGSSGYIMWLWMINPVFNLFGGLFI